MGTISVPLVEPSSVGKVGAGESGRFLSGGPPTDASIFSTMEEMTPPNQRTDLANLAPKQESHAHYSWPPSGGPHAALIKRVMRVSLCGSC